MFSLRKPDAGHIRAFLQQRSSSALSYPEVGATAGDLPAGYNTDHLRVRLGEGEQVFAAGKVALLRWEEFRTGWTELYWPDTPLQQGQVVAVLARVFGVWTLNACRIVYVVDESNRSGFAYGTLPDHTESGEERFLVERVEDGSVWYDIRVFSRPHHFFARLAGPLARRLQDQFRRDSAAAMTAAVKTA
jgi:uncharacterized protein (UPF0548 family)